MIDVHLRVRVAELLAEAAELEHGFTCQYLYAAFSLRRRPDEGVTWAQLELMRRWEASIMVVARQEMEHLGIVSNILTAIGQGPYFQRPNFPLRGGRNHPLDVPFKLQTLCLDSIVRFILFEWPSWLDDDTRERAERVVPAANRGTVGVTVQALYGEILQLLEELDSPELWIGPPSAQLTNAEIIPVPVRGISLVGRTFYSVNLPAVYDLKTATAAIDQVISEGEGAGEYSPTSHFARFLDIAEGLVEELARDPEFTPGRTVVEDPRCHVENPTARDTGALFDLAYGTLMLMLMRYFAQTDETLAESAALQNIAFFPLMTTVIRPLGELLTELPARDDAPIPTAGPAFDFTPNLVLLPHKHAAWHVILDQLKQIADDAKRLTASPAYTADMRARMTLVYENAARMAMTFEAAMMPA